MKRDNRGVPVVMVHQWSRPPASCRRCREKKQRCDRSQPCSNCTIRNVQCEYGWQSQSSALVDESTAPQVPPNTFGPNQTASRPLNLPINARLEPASLNAEETLYRLRKLEEAVFGKPNQALPPTTTTWPQPECGARDKKSSASINFTPISSHLPLPTLNEPSLDIAYIAGHLPPTGQARDLFNHFALTLHPIVGVLHIPSTRELMEQTYQSMLEGEEPSIANLLLLLSIFSSATLGSTPRLLGKLKSTQIEAKAASKTYIRLAMSIVNDTHRPLDLSTITLAAIINLFHLHANFNGLSHEVSMLRMRCLLIARAMKIHRLDTSESREERRLKSCNMIEIEVQRRLWWNIVSSDWLIAFSGDSQEGTYTIQLNHMNVNYPSNVNDEFVTPTMVENDFPLSTLTNMSAFIYRIKLADLCRQVVDAMPSALLESTAPEYEIVLALDEKFQAYLNELPDFYRLDQNSIQQSKEAYKEQHNLPWQRIGIHFGLHTRLCRLHRPYHLEGLTNPKYAYSHTTCIRSAQTVLELRRLLEDACAQVGIKPSSSWIVMEHVFLAALILATDVSFDPKAPDAEARKAKVLAAYHTLEKSKEESNALIGRIQRNMQALMLTLQKRRSQTPNSQPKGSTEMGDGLYGEPNETVSNGQPSRELGISFMVEGNERAIDMQAPLSTTTSAGDGIQNTRFQSEAAPEEEDWNQLWSEFLAVAPELDVPQWNLLLDDTGFGS